MDFSQAYEVIEKKLNTWLNLGLEALPNILIALLVVVIFHFIGKVTSRVFDRFLGARYQSKTAASLMSGFLRLFILIVGVACAIGILGLQKTVISLLAGAGIAGLAIGLAFQEAASNIVSGLILGVKKPFRMGHLIKVDDFFGTAMKLELRTTTLLGRNGEHIVIPNKKLLESTLVNYSVNGSLRKKINVGISYADDLEAAIACIKEALEGLDFIDQGKGIDVFPLEFADSGVMLSVRFWYHFPSSEIGYRESESMAIIAIKKALDSKGLTIPFPITTLDFGIKGGVSLQESLSK